MATKDLKPGTIIHGAVAHDGTMLPPAIDALSAEAPATETTAETSIENAAPKDQPLDGPAPQAEGAPGADTAEGGAQTDPDAAPVEGEPPVTIRRLRAVIYEVESRNTDLHREALIRELVDDHGAVYDAEAGTLTIDGITATPATKRPAQILATWCSAARRAILSGAIPE